MKYNFVLNNGNVIEFKSGELYRVNLKKKQLYNLKNGSNYYFNYHFNEIYKLIIKVYKDSTLNEVIWRKKVIPILTDEEKIILNNISKIYRYIARDKDNRLFIYVNKCIKDKKSGVFNPNDFYYLDFTPFNHLFKCIQWDDDEIYSIEELIKGEIYE